MTYVAIWLWFCGAYMSWESTRDSEPVPDARYPGYSAESHAFYLAHPELRAPVYILGQIFMVVLWPVAMTFGIFCVARSKLIKNKGMP